MAVELTDAGFKKIGLDTPEPWVDLLNSNWDLLQSINAVGGSAVSARDVDPITYQPTSLYTIVSSGWVIRGEQTVLLAGISGLAVNPSSQTYFWLDMYGSLYYTPTLPMNGAYIPLAFVTADATKIISIVDLRNPLRPVGGPLAVSRVVVNEDYIQEIGVNYIRVDATIGPITITLSTARINLGSLTIIRKADASANPVTIAAAEGIEGAASIQLTARGSVVLASDGDTYEIAI